MYSSFCTIAITVMCIRSENVYSHSVDTKNYYNPKYETVETIIFVYVLTVIFRTHLVNTLNVVRPQVKNEQIMIMR